MGLRKERPFAWPVSVSGPGARGGRLSHSIAVTAQLTSKPSSTRRSGPGRTTGQPKRSPASRTSATRKGSRSEPPHDALMREVLLQFRIVVRAIRRHYRRVEVACGISGAQLWALAHVESTPGVRVGELARELAIHQSTASNMLDKLESAGLMERRRTDTDQRVVRLFVTTKGKRVLRRAPRPLRGVLQQGLIDLSTPALTALQRQLGQLVRQMEVRDADPKGTLLENVIENDS